MNNLLLITGGIMLLINALFFLGFEKEKPKPQDILPIVVICCSAALGRVVFAVIPQVQPVTALVIITGSVFGVKRGYVTGALCALVSNIFLGQGPWTLFQMTAWGSIGAIAGIWNRFLPFQTEKSRTIWFAVYGFFSAYLFSFITDFLTICYLGVNFNMSSVIAVYLSGFAFAIGHAIGNVMMIWFLYPILVKKLCRIKNKLSL